MKRVLKAAGKVAKRFCTAAIDLYRRYPARGNSYILAAILVVVAALGIGVDGQSVGKVIEWVVPILLAGEGTHHLVSPAR